MSIIDRPNGSLDDTILFCFIVTYFFALSFFFFFTTPFSSLSARAGVEIRDSVLLLDLFSYCYIEIIQDG